MAQQWSLSSEPVFTIGTADGADDQILAGVTAAFRLTTGDLVVVNSQAHEILIFDSSGALIRAFGRRRPRSGRVHDGCAFGVDETQVSEESHRYWWEHQRTEIADMEDISIDNSRTRLHRARQGLQSRLDGNV